MKKITKIISMLLIAMLLFSTSFACSKNDNDPLKSELFKGNFVECTLEELQAVLADIDDFEYFDWAAFQLYFKESSTSLISKDYFKSIKDIKVKDGIINIDYLDELLEEDEKIHSKTTGSVNSDWLYFERTETYNGDKNTIKGKTENIYSISEFIEEIMPSYLIEEFIYEVMLLDFENGAVPPMEENKTYIETEDFDPLEGFEFYKIDDGKGTIKLKLIQFDDPNDEFSDNITVQFTIVNGSLQGFLFRDETFNSDYKSVDEIAIVRYDGTIKMQSGSSFPLLDFETVYSEFSF